MNWTEQCAAVIPCHNESGYVGPVIAGARRFFSTIIVVDDGSTDDTAKIAEDNGAVCVRHLVSQGKGAALLSGFKTACQLGFAWTLTMDGDGQHSPEDIPAFLHQAEKSSASLIVGNRMGQSSRMPFVRRTVNRLMSRWLSNYTGCALPDSQCGFRLLRLSALPQQEFATRQFEFESEILVTLAQRGEAIDFVPVTVTYGDEQSKIRALPDACRWLSWWRSLPRTSMPAVVRCHRYS